MTGTDRPARSLQVNQVNQETLPGRSVPAEPNDDATTPAVTAEIS